MAEQKSPAAQRLTQVKDFLAMSKAATTIPWDPDCTKFPSRKELPKIEGAPDQAAWVWGADDHIGRLNLLTPARVAAAAKEIRTGEMVPVNLPLNVPAQPAFDREPFKHEIKVIFENIAYDDLYHLNTQSGTQWDGFRHFAHVPSGNFYNGAKGTDIVGPSANNKCSIHYWAEHGIAGRAVLLDYRAYAYSKGILYDSFDRHAIPYSELAACGKAQGIDIRPTAQGGDIRIGDILLIRSGWKETYDSKTPSERCAAALRHGNGEPGDDGQRWAGVAQEEEVLDWLHDCYFAAVGGDAPAFEVWPTQKEYHLHEYVLALWGMPLGEMMDLERLAEKCRERGRWFFFFTSAPANCPGGVSSHVNGTAIF
ncbi:hypothetical protein BU23DRAFT_218444 [Bimuria novae-zelandiae CBS 107.79]|uniref:Cyclase n=1 Tax=Bimuria novae-zelandiae CBS 107.79 TaxID=1447943 RepID=A0A6A5UZP8_9PLEO|nr:hypothetical protein BU23DRAFT_218444 [Bimuria novae-zelandiae CBS 107.79]